MLNKNHCRGEFSYELFDLHSGIQVDKIERLIPDIEMRMLAQASGYQYLFLLSF